MDGKTNLKNYIETTISEKNAKQLGTILQKTEEVVQEDILEDGPLDGYYDVARKIGAEVAFEELTNIFTKNGLVHIKNIGASTMHDFWQRMDKFGGKERNCVLDELSSEAYYISFAEFVLLHLEVFKNLPRDIICFVDYNVGDSAIIQLCKEFNL